MNKSSVLVWIPLKPGSSWRAEGIAETIENIALGMNNIELTILVNKDHYHILNEVLIDKINIKIVPLSLKWLFFKKKGSNPKNKNYYTSDNFSAKDISLNKNLVDIVFNKFFNKTIALKNSFRLVGYATRLKIFVIFQRLGFFNQHKKIWLPVPILTWISQLKGNKILSFWDPFGFEYRDFNDISFYLYKNFVSTFDSVDTIITQSNNNKEYLHDIFGIDDNKIKVIYSAYPDYSKYANKLQGLSRLDLINQWEAKTIKREHLENFLADMHDELINHSILFRLQKRLTKNTKILIISTQARPYKGFPTLFKVLDYMTQNYSSDLYFIFTGLIPKELKIKYSHLHENIIEINRVSQKQHALLYMISDLAIHPSFVEGGLGTYPQFEAASVGTPCLINRGRHTDEMVDTFGDALLDGIIEFTNIHATFEKITSLLDNTDKRIANIQAILNSHRSWLNVCKEYETVFTEGEIL